MRYRQRKSIIPNFIAYSALVLWPFVSFILFQIMSARKAIIWSILGAFLLLPVGTGFDAPGIPNMDKTIIPNLSVLVWSVIFARYKIIVIPRNKILVSLMLLYISSPFLTMLNNQEPLRLSVSSLPGMTIYDGVSVLAGQLIILIPFLIGYSSFKTESDIRDILKALLMAALAYSILILWEVRMSPQLHAQLYGFSSSDFVQQVRADGFRATVFLGHGLTVAIFVGMATVAAVGMWRDRMHVFGLPGAAYTMFLLFILILCKSLGALILAFLFSIASYLLRYRHMITILAISGIIIVAYPLLRGTGLIPINTIAEVSSKFSSDRGASLQTRIDNEEALLHKAAEKPIFGWGTWGRGRIYKTHWSGKFDYDATITDGTWIIIISSFGWAGYIATFGLLAYPTARGFQNRKLFAKFPSFIVLMGVLVVNLFDLLPNSSLTPITWLIAGALAGFTPRHSREKKVFTEESFLSNQRQPSLHHGVHQYGRM